MNDALAGRRILILEDEPLVAMLLETIIEDLGATPIGPAATLKEGLAMTEGGGIDVAMLDVNLAGLKSFPVAQVLADQGVPFIFSTGYGEGGLPTEWRGRITIQKPFTEAVVRDALLRALEIKNV